METVLCPSCGKASPSAPCPRCGCDTAPLFAILEAARGRIAAAAASLRHGYPAEAREQAGESWNLRHTREAARLAFLACVAMEDFDWAAVWRHRA